MSIMACFVVLRNVGSAVATALHCATARRAAWDGRFVAAMTSDIRYGYFGDLGFSVGDWREPVGNVRGGLEKKSNWMLDLAVVIWYTFRLLPTGALCAFWRVGGTYSAFPSEKTPRIYGLVGM